MKGEIIGNLRVNVENVRTFVPRLVHLLVEARFFAR